MYLEKNTMKHRKIFLWWKLFLFMNLFLLTKKSFLPSLIIRAVCMYVYCCSSQCLVFFLVQSLIFLLPFGCFCCFALWDFNVKKHAHTYPATKGGRQLQIMLPRITHSLSELSWIIVYIYYFISTFYNTPARFHSTNRAISNEE